MSRHPRKTAWTRVLAAASGAVPWTAGQAAVPGAPIPATPPIHGALWTVVMPVALFAVSFLATYALYRHFSDE